VDHAPLGGITRGGYKIVYTDQPNSSTKAAENLGLMNAWYSIGLVAEKDGTIRDVLYSSPAYKAELGPGMKIVAVDGRTYTSELMHNVIRDAKNSKEPITLIVVNTGYYRTVKIDYHGGERYPHLERVNSKPDLLDQILKPLATHPKS
jgi:predicted metalloprotease with PDZ domain